MQESVRATYSQIEVGKALTEFMSEEEAIVITKHIVARFKIHKMVFNPSVGFNDYFAEDFVNDTIERFFITNGRKWYKDKDFRKTFYGALDSVISNFISKHAPKVFATDHLEATNCSPISKEDQPSDSLLQICLEYLKNEGASDNELLIFEPYILKEKKRDVLAKELGVAAEDMTKIQNKLNRKIPKLQSYLNQLGYEA